MNEDISVLNDALAYAFEDEDLLRHALRHRGVVTGDDNEHLEFLGDRVLGLVIADFLTENFADEKEGGLAKRLAKLVSRKSCAKVARIWGLQSFLVKEQESQKRQKPTPRMLADCCEAVIAAVYLDGGLEAARHVIETAWKDLFEDTQNVPIDAKTALQEWALKNAYALPIYEILAKDGPDHEPEFTMQVTVATYKAQAIGRSRRAGEQAAAQFLLDKISTL